MRSRAILSSKLKIRKNVKIGVIDHNGAYPSDYKFFKLHLYHFCLKFKLFKAHQIHLKNSTRNSKKWRHFVVLFCSIEPNKMPDMKTEKADTETETETGTEMKSNSNSKTTARREGQVGQYRCKLLPGKGTVTVTVIIIKPYIIFIKFFLSFFSCVKLELQAIFLFQFSFFGWINK